MIDVINKGSRRPPMADKIPLSIAIITKNEEENLPDCLKSIEFAGQIVVVDAGSTDKTVQIAAQFGCEVFCEPWQGFGLQKQSAVDKCRHPWVLVLDADERIPKETAALIRKIVLNPSGPTAGYTFPRKNYFQGRWMKHMGLWPDRVLRLFDKDLGRMTPAKVHEALAVRAPIEDLDTPIEHYPADQLAKILSKIDQYSTLGAQEAYAQGRKTSIASAVFRAMIAFLQNYFLRLGFLEGSPGLTFASTDAINKFFKYAKLAELNRKRDSTNIGHFIN